MASRRRKSKLSESYHESKVRLNRDMSPAERLKKALELSELAIKLNGLCSKKR